MVELRASLKIFMHLGSTLPGMRSRDGKHSEISPSRYLRMKAKMKVVASKKRRKRMSEDFQNLLSKV
jgi:hypothetical protein